MSGHVEANLVSLNELIAEMIGALLDHGIGDAEFAEMAIGVLREHSFALGYMFQGQSGTAADPQDGAP